VECIEAWRSLNSCAAQYATVPSLSIDGINFARAVGRRDVSFNGQITCSAARLILLSRNKGLADPQLTRKCARPLVVGAARGRASSLFHDLIKPCPVSGTIPARSDLVCPVIRHVGTSRLHTSPSRLGTRPRHRTHTRDHRPAPGRQSGHRRFSSGGPVPLVRSPGEPGFSFTGAVLASRVPGVPVRRLPGRRWSVPPR
jgi:hypothetical protein